MNTHLYLRASTKDQHADRAQASLEAFAVEKGLTIIGTYSENISGTKLNRPELMRLLELAQPGDVLLVESVDRLSRLSQADWRVLRSTIDTKGLRLVVHDLPTSHMMVEEQGITGQIMKVINDMLIDLMATMARLDQEKRVERINQGLANKRINEGWTPPGKAKNAKKWEKVTKLLKEHPTMSAEDLATLAKCGVATVYRIKRELKAG